MGEVILWIAAVAGVACIVLVIVANVAGITLIMFRTGSMTPTIPSGSVAVVQRTPASEVAVGDVVTIDRADQLPVTHRVVAIADGGSDAERMITMRGDANDVDDPQPYTVTEVRTVLFSVPGIAPILAALGSPLAAGGITIAAALLVGWAFWPRERT
ncbi:signal peptidase I [Microbacterium indicum]|uniref:signal peptidase I n=1 Tax=Microbacterium indicum TaxID=358100 RepID=UPI00055A5976|nr:signal peptidase I [Microbacterium indicum]